MPLRFSVTQPPQFEIRPEVNVPGNIDMASSVFADYPYLDANTQGILQLVEDDDYENIERFVEAPDYRNPLQKALDFYKETPQARLGIGALLGGIPGAITSLFAPKIFDSVSEGIGNIFGNRMDMDAFNKGMQSAMDDTDPADQGVSSFDAAVSAGIQAAEDDI